MLQGNTQYNDTPIVTYKDKPIEIGAHMFTGHAAHKPSRQPTVHFGMKAIPKLAAEMNVNRANEFVFSEVYFVVTAEMEVRTAGFPNRFTKPKQFTVGLENAVTGTGDVPNAYFPVTFGLINN